MLSALATATASAAPFTFRWLDESDEPALRDLHDACAIGGDERVVLDRGLDFFAWPRNTFQSFRYVGCHSRGRLVGSVLGGTLPLRFGGDVRDVLYLGDARVRASVRGLGVLSGALRIVVQHFAHRVDMGLCVRRLDNPLAHHLATMQPPVPGVWSRTFTGSILTINPHDGSDLRAVTAISQEEGVAFYRRAGRARSFAPNAPVGAWYALRTSAGLRSVVALGDASATRRARGLTGPAPSHVVAAAGLQPSDVADLLRSVASILGRPVRHLALDGDPVIAPLRTAGLVACRLELRCFGKQPTRAFAALIPAPDTGLL